MTTKELEREIMNLQERTLTLEIALEKIRNQLSSVLGKWPVIQELLHQLGSGYLRDR